MQGLEDILQESPELGIVRGLDDRGAVHLDKIRHQPREKRKGNEARPEVVDRELIAPLPPLPRDP